MSGAISGRNVFASTFPVVLTAIGVALLAAGCTTAEGDADPLGVSDVQPRLATYRCDSNAELKIENRGSSVLIASGETSVELPAAPADQTNRYSEDSYALLLDGTDAMWIANGKPPLTCKR